MKTSVCMAVYNGEFYISQQLDSILKQSKRVDEIIIVDDCSSDSSSIIIQSYQDKLPISYYKNEINIGVISSFERAIFLSSGDVILLCDQDDIWPENRVEVFYKQLDNNRGVAIGNFVEIDKYGVKLHSQIKFEESDFTVLSTLLKNRFIGCCMAFTSDLKTHILPFPKYIPMHDSWIGLNAKFCSSVSIVSETVTFYRRHDSNVTGRKKPFWKQVVFRIKLLIALGEIICGK